MSYTINIPIAVSPAVKKFIASRYPVDPFPVSTKNCYGAFLFNSLVRLKCNPNTPYKRLKPEIYSETLMLQLSEDMYRRNGWFIPEKKQFYFNQMVEEVMNLHFVHFMSVQTLDLGRRHRNSYLTFRELFGLTEDDLPLKTMEKRWERERMAISA